MSYIKLSCMESKSFELEKDCQKCHYFVLFVVVFSLSSVFFVFILYTREL